MLKGRERGFYPDKKLYIGRLLFLGRIMILNIEMIRGLEIQQAQECGDAFRDVVERKIPGRPGYTAASDGHVIGPRGHLVGSLNRDGYLVVSFGRSGRQSKEAVHRLVLKTFAREPFPGEQCRHLDGDRLNNAIENLRWGTAEQNNQDKKTHARERAAGIAI